MPRLVRWLWAALMLALPFSSFPLISRTLGVQSVAALSVVFLFILLVVWCLPYLWHGGRLPLAAIPILAFVLVALFATFGSMFIDMPAFRDFSRWRNTVENLVTLGVGISAYLIASSWPAEKKDFDHLLRWLNYGGALIILWSGIQAYYAFITGVYPAWLETIQGWISSSGLLYFRRVTGLAFEPSWLAHMLNLIYLPWWLAASLNKTTVHRFRLWHISLENLLLVGGIGVLFASYSRIGWLAFLVVAAFVILNLNLRLIGWLRGVITRRWSRPFWQTVGRTALPIVLSIGLVGVYAGMFLGAGFGLSKLDPRMAQLFDVQTLKEEGVLMFSSRLVFAERLVFWQTGYEIFNDHPVLGVGLGNAGYYFPEKMVAFGYGLTEISQMLFENSSLPNTKSLWSRLAAETGLAGLGIFLTWMVIQYACARTLTKAKDRQFRALGWFGQFVLVALLIEGFSVDTFALPYFWLALGIVTAGFTVWVNVAEQADPVD
ncbi:MAG TPA: O-antigen ligase family protein [Bellilinea sp.]|nr:O-antigen ligase family protein [Bellilinea sp.]